MPKTKICYVVQFSRNSINNVKNNLRKLFDHIVANNNNGNGFSWLEAIIRVNVIRPLARDFIKVHRLRWAAFIRMYHCKRAPDK